MWFILHISFILYNNLYNILYFIIVFYIIHFVILYVLKAEIFNFQYKVETRVMIPETSLNTLELGFLPD
jgi:hypothetical protein